MRPMTDSTALAEDGPALRARAERDGYLLIRGLLPREQVEAAAADIAQTLKDAGWISSDADLANGRADLTKFCVEPQPAFMDVFYRQLAKLNLQHLFEASQNPVDQKIDMHQTPESQTQTQNVPNIALAPSADDSQLRWPDQSLPDQTTGSSNSLQGAAAPRSMPPTTTAPVARQLIVIVKNGDGQDRVVTIDQPTPELVSQIRNQSAGAW